MTWLRRHPAPDGSVVCTKLSNPDDAQIDSVGGTPVPASLHTTVFPFIGPLPGWAALWQGTSLAQWLLQTALSLPPALHDSWPVSSSQGLPSEGRSGFKGWSHLEKASMLELRKDVKMVNDSNDNAAVHLQPTDCGSRCAASVPCTTVVDSPARTLTEN